MRVTTFSKGIFRLPYIKAFLGAEKIEHAASIKQCNDVDLIVGWGRKKNAIKARKSAKQCAIPYHSLEDGFVRSIKEKARLTRWKKYLKGKMEALYQKEFDKPEKLRRILVNREKMIHLHHTSVERQMFKAQFLVQEEVQRLSSLPLKNQLVLLWSRTDQYEKKAIEREEKREKKVAKEANNRKKRAEKIKEKIQSLHDELTELKKLEVEETK